MRFPRLFITRRGYIGLLIVVAWFVVTALLPEVFYYAGFALLGLLFVLMAFDGMQLGWVASPISSSRKMDKILSLGDANRVLVRVQNETNQHFRLGFIDELPHSLNMRDFRVDFALSASGSKEIHYEVQPMHRGVYVFGDLNFYLTTRLGFMLRRVVVPQKDKVKVYPSIRQLQEIELKSFSRLSINPGIKRQRRLGHSYEFEQIKSYVQGDDYRSINWKATGRRQALMINQYEDERSQPVYFAIDTGRGMKMPFDGLTLVDYAVNSTLALSNVALKKGDRVGLITFDKQLRKILVANDKTGQLARINESLYNLEQTDTEPDFEQLYHSINTQIRQRSLIFLFTNCNTLNALNRIKPVLQLIQRTNLLVVVLFENTQIADFASRKARTLEEVYDYTIAEEFIYEQQQIALELRTAGIQTIVSAPEDLSVNTVNKYLDLKARGMI
ncbi:MAG: DUF58 domain-containing protein [Flavobacteriales bacterium]|nr:DUF58 domain-containing protein [Flavobacteriales bacterium]